MDYQAAVQESQTPWCPANLMPGKDIIVRQLATLQLCQHASMQLHLVSQSACKPAYKTRHPILSICARASLLHEQCSVCDSMMLSPCPMLECLPTLGSMSIAADGGVNSGCALVSARQTVNVKVQVFHSEHLVRMMNNKAAQSL